MEIEELSSEQIYIKSSKNILAQPISCLDKMHVVNNKNNNDKVQST